MYGSFYITNEVRKIVWLKIEVENNAITLVESQTRHQPQQRWDRNDAHSDQEDLQWIEIRMNLQPFHFSNGQLNLQCNAQIPGVYSKMSEIHLGGGLREPVPERDSIERDVEMNKDCCKSCKI
ncbi:hypothetical protein APICC_08227 [Apis cerana cerana]|uniref:Uncharacterized protein n=1 Tax=Apis cerana cerana TaxID=94128 RepID=A0A2A3ED87_APICC|nr:hypothetical protein APICC_08227 [Apis cerana cerana]